MSITAFWKLRDQKTLIPVSGDDPLPVVLAANPTIDLGEVTVLGEDNATAASKTNPLSTQLRKSTTATQTIVPSANADTVILALNLNRLGAAVYNDSTANLYLLLKATTASATIFTVKMTPATYYEVPFAYNGGISGFWDAVNGNARVTELV